MFYVMILVVGHKSLSNLSFIKLYTYNLLILLYVNYSSVKMTLQKYNIHWKTKEMIDW